MDPKQESENAQDSNKNTFPMLETPNDLVNLNVGGMIYTSSLQTLTSVPDSRLSRIFAGSLPIQLDELRQYYFMDRDGAAFRYILDYMRKHHVVFPASLPDLELLLEEAIYFELNVLVQKLAVERRRRLDAAELEQRMRQVTFDRQYRAENPWPDFLANPRLDFPTNPRPDLPANPRPDLPVNPRPDFPIQPAECPDVNCPTSVRPDVHLQSDYQRRTGNLIRMMYRDLGV